MTIPFLSIPDVRVLFDAVPDDKLIAKMFYYRQTVDLCRLVGADSPKRRIREPLIIGAVREKLSDEVIIPSCPCVGEGRRWHIADEEGIVTYGVSRSVDNVLPLVHDYIHEAFQFVDGFGRQLKLRPVLPGKVPHIYVEAAPYDGPGRTLGVTISYDTPDLDLFTGDASASSVRIIIDTLENWSVNYFRTVFRHEVFHAVGLGHAPEFADLMWANYTGFRLGHPGDWTERQMADKYFKVAA